MNILRSVHAITVVTVIGGARLEQALDEARRLGADYIIFNDRLIPTTATEDLTDYQTRYPDVRELHERLLNTYHVRLANIDKHST